MIKIATVQRGNPVLGFLVNTKWQYSSNTTADYEINNKTAVLFLSLKFHACKPEYIFKRLNRLKEFRVTIVMIYIDVLNFELTLRELFSMLPYIIITCKSYEECARYLRGLDIASARPVEVLRCKETSIDQFLISIPKINKTDVINLRKSYHTLQDLFRSPEHVLSRASGIGPTKAHSIIETCKKKFNLPDGSGAE